MATEPHRPDAGPGAVLRIAMIGTRGVPAAYGGFETAIEEIGARLADRGHEVVVYCRRAADVRQGRHRGMHLVHLAALSSKALETPSHTACSALHMLRDRHFDAAFVFNAANAAFVPIVRRRARGVAIHVDGLEWKRSKWGPMGRLFYRFSESLAVRQAHALIADAQGIADYYRDEFGADTQLLQYGAPVIEDAGHDALVDHGLRPGQYHLVVARFEPENHVDLIVEGYRSSKSTTPLVVVGAAPYAQTYTQKINLAAGDDSRIRLIGRVDDQRALDQLYAHCLTYVHGHSVGGTNPSLLRAMGAGRPVLAYAVNFNSHVTRTRQYMWDSAVAVRDLFDELERDPGELQQLGMRNVERVREHYNWDDVAAGYEDLARQLASNALSRQAGLRRRKPSSRQVGSQRRRLAPLER